MTSYPNLSDASIHVASAFTSLKWGLVGILAVVTLGGLALLAVKRLGKTN